MKIKISLNAAFAAVLISVNAFAGNFYGGKDPLEITYIKNNKAKPDLVYQEQLRKSASWQNFLRVHDKWSVEFNESTQMPHRAYGKPIQAAGTDPKSAAMNFIVTNLGDWKLPINDLKFQSQNFSGKYYNVFYSQTYQGLDVINSRVFIKMTKGFRVNTWGLDVFETNISVVPALSNTVAIEKAKTGIMDQVTDISRPELKILPVPEGHSIVSHLVYELIVSTMSESKIPAKYYTLVDANTGEILYRHNKVNFFQPLNSTVTVQANVFQHNPFIAAALSPLRNLRVNVGGTIYYTDSLGNVSIPGTNPFSAKFSLEGLWSQTVTDQDTSSPSITRILSAGNNIINFDSVTTIHHTSGYYHVNNIHDFMKGFFPGFTDLDFPLPTRIDVTGGTCNAFYSGSDINFYETGGGCNCMSQIADVVYHEYGHGINDLFYQSQGGSFDNSGMNEGYADVWAISLTQDPVLGIGNDISNPNSYIRRYDINKKVYPQDMSSDPHDVGEIIAGAWYDVSLNISSWSNMTALYAKTFYDIVSGPDGTEGTLFPDILLAALTEDDNDSDLTNGSPHDHAILDAFALHGITLINNVSLDHTPVLTASSQLAIPILVNVTAVIQFPWLVTTQEVHYRTDNTSPYSVLPMTLVTGNTYSALIPQQPAGTIVSYYITLLDGFSSPVMTIPAEADSADANIPYFIIVDGLLERTEDFDANQSAGWQTGITGDNATGGQWVIAVPVVSFKNGDTCQTGVQHTPGGLQCAVTGNAASPGSPNYTADVDAGKTTLESPPFNIAGFDETIVSYWRWYTNDQGPAPRADFWQTYISGDGINFIPVENIDVPDHSWRRYAFKVSDYLIAPTTITLRFVGDDANSGSIIEGAVDDIEIYSRNLNNGITVHDDVFNFSIFPNPASDLLTINLDMVKAENISFDVVNNLGQQVLSTESGMAAGRSMRNINIENLDNGIYYLVVNCAEQRMEKMFSVMK